MAFKEAMGILSLVLMVLAYGIYIWQTMREDGVRPHPFSWFLWGFVTGDGEKQKPITKGTKEDEGQLPEMPKFPKNPK
jgi:hypothetical protein